MLENSLRNGWTLELTQRLRVWEASKKTYRVQKDKAGQTQIVQKNGFATLLITKSLT